MESKTTKNKRLRSPGYPLIDLKEAVHKAKILWDKDKSNSIPKEVACEHLGYQTKEGYAGRIIAALKQFGLISDKHGDIILTQDAMDLAIYEPGNQDYSDIVKRLALNPGIYDKIYNEGNANTASDSALKIKLIKDYGFHPDKVNNFLNNFRSTIAFADLLKKEEKIEDMQTNDSNITVNADPIKGTMEISGTPIIDNAVPVGYQSFPVPLSKGRKAAITFESLPIEKEDVENIKKWLDLFSGTLTEAE